MPDWKANAGFLWHWKRHYNIRSKTFNGERADAPDVSEYVEKVVKPVIAEFGADNVYNTDETGIWFKMLPHRTNCLAEEDVPGNKVLTDRLTLLLITNMSGTDKVKPIVIW